MTSMFSVAESCSCLTPTCDPAEFYYNIFSSLFLLVEDENFVPSNCRKHEKPLGNEWLKYKCVPQLPWPIYWFASGLTDAVYLPVTTFRRYCLRRFLKGRKSPSVEIKKASILPNCFPPLISLKTVNEQNIILIRNCIIIGLCECPRVWFSGSALQRRSKFPTGDKNGPIWLIVLKFDLLTCWNKQIDNIFVKLFWLFVIFSKKTC